MLIKTKWVKKIEKIDSKKIMHINDIRIIIIIRTLKIILYIKRFKDKIIILKFIKG